MSGHANPPGAGRSGSAPAARAVAGAPWVRRVDNLLWALGAGLFVVHFAVLLRHAVNVPYLDEWEYLRPGALDHRFDLGWLLRAHNEHRIVLSKLETWLMLRLGGWNLASEVAINFWLYVALVVFLLRWLGMRQGTPMGLCFVLAASTVPWENHTWGIQSCIHGFLLFYFLALRQIGQPGRQSWLAVLFAAASAYSFSSGAIAAASVAALALAKARIRRGHTGERRRAYLQAAAVLAVIAIWMAGYHKNPAHPPFAWPTSRPFWEYLFNVCALGVGVTALGWVPGLILVAAAAALAGARVASWPRLSEAERLATASLLALAAGIGASLVAITVARAGFGVTQAKSSRYAEIAQVLLPVVWIWLDQTLRARAPGRMRLGVLALAAILLAAPYRDDFHYREVYARVQRGRVALQDCLRAYYEKRGDGSCFAGYPAQLSTQLDRAHALGLHFEAPGGAAR